jgi:hypothetical protein
MVAYEFYLNDSEGNKNLIGTLPERRRNPRRITHKSVINWGKKIIGENTDFDNIFFYQVTIDKTTGEILKFKVHEDY